VLTASAVAISSHASELVARPLTEPRLTSTLCLGASATKKATPLVRRVSALLTTLVAGLAQA
jgi:LysR family nitrogen assimilation transcriptional regulator